MEIIENFSQDNYDKMPVEEAICDDVIDMLFDNGEFVEGCDDAVGFIGSYPCYMDCCDNTLVIHLIGHCTEKFLRSVANDVVKNLCEDDSSPFSVRGDERPEMFAYDDEDNTIFQVFINIEKSEVVIYLYYRPAD